MTLYLGWRYCRCEHYVTQHEATIGQPMVCWGCRSQRRTHARHEFSDRNIWTELELCIHNLGRANWPAVALIGFAPIAAVILLGRVLQ